VQQVSTAQNDPAGHAKSGEAPHGPIAEHEVLPRTQNPPPWALRTQTQPAFAAHATNVVQVAPWHSGFGPGDTCAETFATDAMTIGATYAAPPICSDFLIRSRRFTRIPPGLFSPSLISLMLPPKYADWFAIKTQQPDAVVTAPARAR
jgi:hypothetical protein